MLGIWLNLCLAVFATLSLSAGISFFVEERDAGYTRGYVLLFGIAACLICGGYAVMGFMPQTEYTFIPRLIGLYGIDVFLLMELSYLTLELHRSQGIRSVIIGFFALYVLLDLIVFGRPSALIYVRYKYHTAYENANPSAHLFHYSYVAVIAVTLLVHGVQWVKAKKIKRDKIFAIELISANFAILFAAIPDIFKSSFAAEYPTFMYSLMSAVLYFSFWFAVKQHIMFTPTVKNVSQEIFNSVDVPIILFDLEGEVCLYNPCAAQKLKIEYGSHPSLRNLFSLSDVETLHLLARAKNGWRGVVETKIKASDELCSLSCSVKSDSSGEPFCVIGAILAVRSQSI